MGITLREWSCALDCLELLKKPLMEGLQASWAAPGVCQGSHQ